MWLQSQEESHGSFEKQANSDQKQPNRKEIEAVEEQVAETTLDQLNGLQVAGGRQHREQMLLIFQLFAQPRHQAPEYQDMHFCSNLTMAVKWYTIINGPAQSTPAKKKGSPFDENYLHLLRIRWAIWQNIAFMKEYDM